MNRIPDEVRFVPVASRKPAILSMRLESELLDRIDYLAECVGCNRSEFIRQAIEYAITNMVP